MSAPAEARLRALMASAPAAVAVVDAEGRVLEANDRWAALRAALGAEGGGAGGDWRDLLQPSDRAAVAPGAAGAEVRGRGPAGAARWLSASMAPVGEEGSEAVVTLRDIDAARRDAMERTALHRIAELVTRGDDTAAVFGRVAEEVGVLLDADGAGVAQFGAADHARLVGRWAADPDLLGQAGDELPLQGDGTTARVFATGRPHRVDYAGMAGGAGVLPHPWQVSAAAPIRVEGRLWGALGVVSRRGDRLAADAEERLARFADFVGIAIANAEAREQLVLQARTDPLTGLPHHGAFHASLHEEVARSARYGHPLSLAVIDIDHFKRVNDAHGHLVGDRTLTAVAGVLRDHARAIDMVARIGGEEFAWLMPQTALTGARSAAERFREAVAAAPVGEAGRLTVSVGVATLDRRRPDGDGLFRRADAALYRAKDAGRDRTMTAAGPPAA